jgi:Domain of unknown function (DUF2017)
VGDHGARQLTSLFSKRLIRWDRQAGAFRLNMSENDRTVLRELAPQFLSLMDDPEQPVVKRLFPPAYSDPAHAEHQEEYRRLMLEDLVERHRAELELLAETSTAETLSEEQLLTWTRALNSIRLVLGTYLDVSEDDEARSPETPDEAVYQWLTYVLGEAIEALDGQT